MADRLLVTGATGHLGRTTVQRAVAAGWSVSGTYLTAPSAIARERLDIRDPAAVRELLHRLRPDAVIHTAAGRDDWHAIADGAAHVAVAAAALGIRLVHVSSDAIFSGREVHYDETAPPDPVYRYGAAKAAAETAIRAIDPTAAVVRTSTILGDGGGAHEVLTHQLASGRADGVLFTDQLRKPIHVDDLADALLELATNRYPGIINVAGPDVISRYDLGLLVARRDGLDPALIPAGAIAERGLRLPADVRLRTDTAESVLRTRLRGAQEFMARVRVVHLSGPAFQALADGDVAAANALSPVPVSDYLAGPACRSVWRMRSRQAGEDPQAADWVTGIIWDERRRTAVGRAGFHAPPDADGMVEIGYAVDPAHRRQGYARAALEILLARAAREPGVRRIRVSIAPDNVASYQLASQYGFRKVGEQWDDEDGLEFVYEAPAGRS
ncbi:GNAT family N-acetyltransferase [Couchioplanes caeruleus]|uniref:dTDP-4-dehydrorhamnose reductase n=1 Tax=Couchioplanes caeruleus TaxID=56438 RepID=A0A3N1GBK1_9ACTN|nr:dTDP-4-dehydrorhamnose reductase [Couchioplanes caeruleus]